VNALNVVTMLNKARHIDVEEKKKHPRASLREEEECHIIGGRVPSPVHVFDVYK
jgi:hypothetical protein